MQESIPSLTRKAISASLKGSWKEAVEYNTQILEKSPRDLDAKNRLGRALMQLGEFPKAKKIFKDVLTVDPINQVAQRNYKLATDKKIEKNSQTIIDPRNLIKEPGCTTEIQLDIEAKRLNASNFMPGEQLEVKLANGRVEFYKKNSRGTGTLVSKTNSEMVKKLTKVKKLGGTFSAYFSSGLGKKIVILVRSSVSVFRAQKQEVKPYIKRGSIEEPELEISTDYEE
jgi:tetratricopeptide (TPR) repeat protein